MEGDRAQVGGAMWEGTIGVGRTACLLASTALLMQEVESCIQLLWVTHLQARAGDRSLSLCSIYIPSHESMADRFSVHVEQQFLNLAHIFVCNLEFLHHTMWTYMYALDGGCHRLASLSSTFSFLVHVVQAVLELVAILSLPEHWDSRCSPSAHKHSSALFSFTGEYWSWKARGVSSPQFSPSWNSYFHVGVNTTLVLALAVFLKPASGCNRHSDLFPSLTYLPSG